MKRLLSIVILLVLGLNLKASHILGGELFYDHVAGSTYQVTLILYMDCNSGTDETNAQIFAYPKDGSASTDFIMPRIFNGYVDNTYFLNPCLTPPSGSCMRKSIYQLNTTLPPGTGGYDLNYEQFARSAAIDNITLPDNYSSIYFCSVPDPNDPLVGTPNSSPRFVNDPPISLCINDSFAYNHSAYDPDGDLITYTICTPKGNAGAAIGGPPPYPNIPYCCGYTVANPMPATVPISIDPTTGLLVGEPNTNGQWVFSVCYTETRGGVVISEGTRDYVFEVKNCSPVVPTPGVVAQSTATTSGYCGDLTVDFQNGSANAIFYHWDFGDTTITTDTSSLENPTYTYTKPGVYNVMLIANPGSACADTAYSVFQVYPHVDINFTQPGPQCNDNNSFTFSLSDFNENDSIVWDFGGATPNSSTDTMPSGIVYPNPGTYTVTVTGTNPTCTTTVSKDITVLQSPFPFYQKPDPQCVSSNSFAFIGNGSSGPGSQFAWDFGPSSNVGSSSQQNALGVSFVDTGYQVVTLNITDASGCIGTFIDSVYISPPPAPSFAPTDTQCQNNSKYVFTSTGEYGPTATFSWNFGPQGLPNSATTEDVDSVHFATSGEHIVTFSVTEYGCTRTYTDTVYVADAPYAFMHPEANQCVLNQDFDFQGGGIYGPGAQFLWDFGGNANVDSVKTIDANDVTFNAIGTFDVSFSITESGCTDTYTVPISVTAKPEASFPIQGDACLSDGPFDFINTGSFGSDATFSWDFDSNANPPTANTKDVTNVSWSTAGTYTVCLTISENGCDSVYCETFTLTPAPSASYPSLNAQCVGNNSFNFTNTGNYGPGAIFNWDFGPMGPGNSNMENPSNISFANPGFHPVTLSVTENNCTDIYVDTVYVSAIPSPNYTVPAPECIDINSFDLSAGGGYGPDAVFNWNFGSNAVPQFDTAQNPTGITFSSVGYQPVSLTIDENGCSTTYVDSLLVTPAPNPFFTKPSDGCVSNNSYSFAHTGTNGSAANFLWDFGPNASPSTANTQNPSGISFNTVGAHLVSLDITENGCTYTYTDTLHITAPPSASANAQTPQCLSINSFDFVGSGTYGNAATFLWDFGPNASPATSTDINETGVVFGTTGSHSVSFAITENGCTDTYTYNIDITDPPGADFQPNGPQCINANNFNFQTLGLYGTAASFDWDFGPNAVPANSILENPSNVSFNQAGWQTISLTVLENGCPNTYIDSVEITPNPIAGYDQLDDMCLDINSFDFSQNGLSGSAANYTWDFGPSANPVTSSDQNPSGVVFNTAGLHQVTLTISENGCTDTYTSTVNVTPSPVATFTKPTPQCVDVNEFDFLVGGSFGPTATYSWDFGSEASVPTSSSFNPTGVIYPDSGYYPVSLTIEENGCTHVYTDTVVVYPIPTVAFDAVRSGCVPFIVEFENQSFAWNEVDYFWTFGDGSTSTDQNPSHEYKIPGSFNVTLTLTSAEGCIGSYMLSEPQFVQAFLAPKSKILVTPDSVVTAYDPVVDVYDISEGAISSEAYLLNTGAPLSLPTTIEFPDTGTYTIAQYVLNQYGCVDTLYQQVRVDPEFHFFAPNAFSPNDDGVNDVYYQKGYGIKEYELFIYTRWGEYVFSTTDIEEGWNGIQEGKTDIAKQDTYIWKVYLLDSFGVSHSYSGEVTLFK